MKIKNHEDALKESFSFKENRDLRLDLTQDGDGNVIPIVTPATDYVNSTLREGKLAELWLIYQLALEEYIKWCGYDDIDHVNYIYYPPRPPKVYEDEDGNEVTEEDDRTPDDLIIEQFRGILISIQYINWRALGGIVECYNNKSEDLSDYFFKGFLWNTVNPREVIPSFYSDYYFYEFWKSEWVEGNVDFSISSLPDLWKSTKELLTILNCIFMKEEDAISYVAENKILLNKDWNVQIFGQTDQDNVLVIPDVSFFPWQRDNLIFKIAEGKYKNWNLIPTHGEISNDYYLNRLKDISYVEGDDIMSSYRLPAPWTFKKLLSGTGITESYLKKHYIL